MRIVSYKEFITLPAGTVYSRQNGGNFGDFEIVTQHNEDGSWDYQNLSASMFEHGNWADPESYLKTLDKAFKEGTEIKVNFAHPYVCALDNEYEEFFGVSPTEHTYAVFGRDEVSQLIRLLTSALAISG